MSNMIDDSACEPTITASGPHVLVTVNANGFKITISKRNLEHFDAQDPYFFDSDYTIAGSTGFLLWEANWLLLRLLRAAPLHPASAAAMLAEPNPSGGGRPAADFGPRFQPATQPLGRLLAGRRVLDLGSGTGLAGLSAAAWGAHVLLTDLASVCEGTLRGNVLRNALGGSSSSSEVAAPPVTATVGASPAAAAGGAECGLEPAGQAPAAAAVQEQRRREPALSGEQLAPGLAWVGAVRVGAGSAAVMALDWTEPLEPQVRAGGNDPRDAEFILAVDTIWLLDIFHAFIDVVLAVLSRGRSPHTAAEAEAVAPEPASSTAACAAGQQQQEQQQRACFLAFVERASADSKLFVRKETVEAELRGRGCEVEVLMAEDVDVDGVARPGRVLRVTLPADR